MANKSGYESKVVVAPRRRALDPENPANKTILFELNTEAVHHPGGQAFVAEGDMARVYPSAKVLALIGTTKLRWATTEEAAAFDKLEKVRAEQKAALFKKQQTEAPVAPAMTVTEIQPGSIASLGLHDDITSALAAAGIETIARLLERLREGEPIDRIGVARKTAIVDKLTEAGYLSEGELDQKPIG